MAKVDKLAVIITNKKGVAYQVALSEDETNLVESLIGQLHKGKIKVLDRKLELTLGVTK